MDMFCKSNKIEDENHFLLDCKAYMFFSKIETKIPNLKSLSHDTLIPPTGWLSW